MKRLLAHILILMLLAACTGPNVPPSAEAFPSSLSRESISEGLSSFPQEETALKKKAAPAGLSEWEKPQKPALEEVSDLTYWVPIQQYLQNCYQDSFDRNIAMERDYFRPSFLEYQLARLNIRLPGETITFDQYEELVALFYGPKTADTIIKAVREETYPSYYIPQAETLRIEWRLPPDQNDSRIDSIDLLNGVEEVRLTVTQLWGGSNGEPYKIFLYDLFWDEWAGYLPRNISWEYAPTQVVWVDGDSAEPWAKPVLFDELWGRSAHRAYDYMSYSSLKNNKADIIAIGQTAYQFYTEGSALLARTLDLYSLHQDT